MVRKVGDSKIVVNLPVTNVPRCIGSNAKTLRLQYLQFLDIGASDGPPNGTRLVHWTDELLIQQNTIPDGETASPVQERSQLLCRFLFTRSTCFDQASRFDWLPEEYCSGFRDAPTGLGEEHRGVLQDIDGDPPFTQPPL